jgi:hypothetical protein
MVARCLTNCSLRIAVVISVSLVSCTKPPITTVNVKVDETFSGYFRLTTCIPGAQDPIVLDKTAEGSTSACPFGDVQVAVLKPSKTFRIAHENVHVHRSANGTPVAISGQIP